MLSNTRQTGVWLSLGLAFVGAYGDAANGYRGVGNWLRGVDLNHRPLGYEPNITSVFNNLQDAGGP